MIHQSLTFLIKKNDREYIFTIPSDAPLGELYDVAGEYMSLIFSRIQEVQSQIKVSEEVKKDDV